jgi:hypothetical protein
MGKIVAWIVTVVGLGGGSLLTRANWIASHLGFLGLPGDLREALIAMSQFPTLFPLSLFIIGIVGIGFLVHDHGFDRSLLQWARKATGRGQETPMLKNILSRVAETERGIAQNKANLRELQTEVEMLTASLRARDAESIIKEADSTIMITASQLLEGAYPNDDDDETSWAADYVVWETAVKRVDGIMSQWAQQHKKFLNFEDLTLGAPVPPSQSNIKSDINVTRYKIVWLAQQSYANRRDGIFIFFASKSGELPA